MKLSAYGLLPILVLFAFNAGAQSIQTKKVTIPAGKDSVNLKSSIKGEKTIDYKINVAAGQMMKVNLKTSSTANYFNVLPPGSNDVAIYNSSMGENSYKGKLEAAGEYTIRVYLYRSAARRNETANFTLTISLPKE